MIATRPETIPPEIEAGVESGVLFDALYRGDYATAARAQERLRGIGWNVTREQPIAPARRTAKSIEARRD